jgi:5-methyltetrahydropteroyltriglutamate--homocysteine methyltransferase
VHGLPNTAPDGFKISFSDGHTRRMSRLTRAPFRYRRYAASYLDVAMRYAHVPVKQAVISPSALSLMYPAEKIPDYSREQFIEDLLNEHGIEICRCLKKGAHKVQVDFTEGRLAVKIDPSEHSLTASLASTTSLCRGSRQKSAGTSGSVPARGMTSIRRTARGCRCSFEPAMNWRWC